MKGGKTRGWKNGRRKEWKKVMEAGRRKEWKTGNGRWKEEKWTDVSWKNNF